MRRLAGGLVCLAAAGLLAPAASAAPGRISVGLEPEADTAEVGSAVVEATGGRLTYGLGPLRALVLRVPDVEAAVAAVAELDGVGYAEPVTASRSIAFEPTDPLAAEQWYLGKVRAFGFWPEPPPLPPLRVAVIDSGIDGTHPEFANRIVASKSFVGTPARVDTIGHGTVVAGEIAAALDNGEGIAGLGLPVELVVAKVVRENGSISTDVEARAIRWAVDQGAQVVNLSLGGPRNPNRPAFDTYSELERTAVDYATRRGVVVVAAAGNCSYRCPEPYANYPAALPHVIGVGATTQSDRVPFFSNRDDVHVDLAAPGVGILSTHPLALSNPACDTPGYTRCALDVLSQQPTGTSFSTPLVSAAVALVLSQGAPFTPHASQVSQLVKSSARDVGTAGRDRLSGNGLLDVTRALRRLTTALPPRDRLEPNDGFGIRSRPIHRLPRTVEATLTRFEDQLDVYRVALKAGERLRLRLTGPAMPRARLTLWRPGAPEIGAGRVWRAARGTSSGSVSRLVFRVQKGGRYHVAVSGHGGAYSLSIARG